MQRVDVAVVGGGPAGSSAGYAAAREGADVVVLEKGVPRADRAGRGPDSTDAAGILDYWVDIMDLDEPIPEHVKHRELSAAEFIGPTETLALTETGIDSTYPNFGFTMHRARFDDWLGERARRAGADYRVGAGVAGVETSLTGEPSHTLTLRDGTEIEAEYLILADGPQRTVTGRVLGRWLPETAMDRLETRRANHIAYQEYRELPPELFEDDRIKFWWGYMPGHTAYPWVFPNDGRVARVGLTMPIDLDLDSVDDRERYRLLRPEDERIPQGGTYIERLLGTVYPEYDLEEFPLRTDRGKSGGTETYPISSTRPIESPTRANVAVVGGAMGATSAFHEGGDHVAVRTGSIAGRLAALGALRAYNAEWHRAIGPEVRRNCIFAEMVRGYGPDDWDRLFGLVDDIVDDDGITPRESVRTGVSGVKLFAEYTLRKFGYRSGRYAQILEDEYAV
ncbi:FAD-dependent oxidoreductase (homolog to geranylgeranyl reductase) [Natronomonas moolapensis 8.8.11]|uniref:FAD-dependent oxidoreductase (Homolog to geranylgeranyl reductase) n=1 Tax=Natronomonas moolapensis (strain DSM 18674 / CECT 7526 / JCM 14361 / 8.8.11) TaxID=268739 RepID=M1Y3T5_NATM8|nr:NAD(P)/FAD-dependent oxidoreductase [Natronomonas moolapensis]CCQ37191.1 FAD-dependent oxidoreductase (homolog to geranylgeranyl reductase) [Natronomonas moolapensis 8.8.11]